MPARVQLQRNTADVIAVASEGRTGLRTNLRRCAGELRVLLAIDQGVVNVITVRSDANLVLDGFGFHSVMFEGCQRAKVPQDLNRKPIAIQPGKFRYLLERG